MTAAEIFTFRFKPRPKGSVVTAFSLCPILLFMSGYGFWQWSKMPLSAHLLDVDELFILLCLTILPLAGAIYLMVLAAQRIEYNWFSASYQSRIDNLQKRLNAQDDLLRTITDHDPEAITIFDRDNRYWFANVSAARGTGVDVSDMIGKSPHKIVGQDWANTLEMRLNEVRRANRSLTTLDQRNDDEGSPQFIQSHFENVTAFGEFPGGVIMRSKDLTSLIIERERRENMLRQVINTLVAVVDRRDPYAAGHSARVGQLARAVAEEMVLDERSIETAEIAGSLMNFGKILVPRELLTKTTPYTPEELRSVRESILTSANILLNIDFAGPVVPTLKQVLERFNGSGVPQGLKGDNILMTARVVAVANAYVALVSPRAHRPRHDYREAVQTLLNDADKLYDRRVVTALANYIGNRASKLDWLGLGKQA